MEPVDPYAALMDELRRRGNPDVPARPTSESRGESTMQIKFQGVKRDGSWSWGVAELGDIHRWVQDCFNSGWQELMVLHDGYEVGGIGRVVGGHDRTWWAET